MEAHHLGAPGAEFWRLSAHCTCCLLCSWLAAHFLPFLFGAPRHHLASCPAAMKLRQLVAQLSVLAALEDFIALGLSRVVGPAGSGRAAAPPDAGSPSAPAVNAASAAPPVVPSPSHEVAASLLRSASLRAASPRTRTRSRSPAPLPKRAPRRSSSVASGLRGSVALAESGLVTGLATKSCPPVPPPQVRLSRVSRALHAASVGSQPSVDASRPSAPSAPASEAPRATESASNSDDEWDALLDAHGLAPSLGGAAAAVAQPADAAGASRRARDKASPPSAQSRQALHVEGHLICSLRYPARFRLARHRCSWVCPGHVHTSEGHVEVLVDAVLSCGSRAARGLSLASSTLALAWQTARLL